MLIKRQLQGQTGRENWYLVPQSFIKIRQLNIGIRQLVSGVLEIENQAAGILRSKQQEC